MRTYTEYEADDISWDDPVHSFLMTQLMINAMTGFKPKPGEDVGNKEDAEQILKRPVAFFLNEAQRKGIVITLSDIPAPFKSAFNDHS